MAVQWRLVPLSQAVQRFGRPARGEGTTGLGVMLVEPSAYKVDPTDLKDAPTTKDTRAPTAQKLGRNNKRSRRTKSLLKPGGTSPDATVQPKIHDESPAEGAYAFAQTPLCRREILTKVFKNPTPGKYLIVRLHT